MTVARTTPHADRPDPPGPVGVRGDRRRQGQTANPAPGRAVVPPRPIGREPELTTLLAWLAPPMGPVVTVCGPGGVGKTTLATTAGHDLAGATGRLLVTVPLASLSAPDLLVPTICRALGGGATDLAGLAGLARARASAHGLLVVLDNAEHLRSGVGEVALALAAAPGTRVLVTSRCRLRVAGEQVLDLSPLGLPAVAPSLAGPGDPAVTHGRSRGPSALDPVRAVLDSAAGSLVVSRLRSADPGFTLDAGAARDIAALCRRLDGLPLALELAAARTRTVPLPFLVARLAEADDLADPDGPQADRHRSLSAVASWSYDLLTPGEQRLFRGLSALPDAFPGEIATAILGWGGAGVDSLLSALVAQNLIARVPSPLEGDAAPWYVMLETLRQFGRERLRDSGEAGAVHGEIARWVSETVQARTVPFPASLFEDSHLEFCRAWLPNVRAALGWLLDAGDAAGAVRLALRVGTFWTLRSYRSEGLSWCERIAARADLRQVPDADLARLWLLTAGTARTQPDSRLAVPMAERSRTLFRAVGDRLLEAVAAKLLGAIHRTAGDQRAAIAHSRRAVELFAGLEEHQWLALSRIDLGDALAQAGDTTSAIAELRLALSHHRAVGDPWGTIYALVGLARAWRHAGQVAEAVGAAREAVALAHRTGARESTLDAALLVAALARDTGHAREAVTLIEAHEALRVTLGYQPEAADHRLARATAAAARADLAPDLVAAMAARGRGLTFDGLVADCLHLLATVAPADRLLAAPSGPPALTLVHAGPLGALSTREWQVLRLLADGLSDREIGERLFISPRTAMRHVANILVKLEAPSRTAAAAIYLRTAPDAAGFAGLPPAPREAAATARG